MLKLGEDKEKRGANTEEMFGMRVGIIVEISEAVRAAVRRDANFATKDVTPDVNTDEIRAAE